MILIALGSSLGGFLTVNIVLAHWFEKYRARAMSIGAMGLSVSGLLVPLVVWALATVGWRVTAAASGVLVLVLGLPAAQLFRRSPEDHGLAPDGEARFTIAERGVAATQRAQAPLGGLTARQALHTPAFWLLTSGHTLALFAVASMQVHLIPFLVDQRHMSVEMAAGAFAGLTTLSWVGQLAGGQLGDRFEKRLICVGCMMLHTTALIILIFAVEPLPLVVGALVHGLAWGMRGPLMMAIRADYFGRRAFAMIEGFASMVTTIGLFFGPLVVGAIADQAGDYRLGFAFVATMTASGVFAFAFARKPVPPPIAAALESVQ